MEARCCSGRGISSTGCRRLAAIRSETHLANNHHDHPDSDGRHRFSDYCHSTAPNRVDHDQRSQAPERALVRHSLLVSVPKGVMIDIETTGKSEYEDEILTLGLKIKGVDLFQPWKELTGRRGEKLPKLDELATEPEEYFKLERTKGSDIPLVWEEYCETRQTELLKKIIRHNQSDLLRELYLLIHYPFPYEL
mgnify:CR=1 FL=1